MDVGGCEWVWVGMGGCGGYVHIQIHMCAEVCPHVCECVGVGAGVCVDGFGCGSESGFRCEYGCGCVSVGAWVGVRG